MGPIYKFMNSRYVDGFLDAGRIKIGSSREYRIPDGKDGGRTDPNELVTIWAPEEEFTVLAPDHPFVLFLYGGPPPWTEPITIKGNGAKLVGRIDAYIFSASSEYSTELAVRMEKEFDADSCVIIWDPDAFAHFISEHAPLNRFRAMMGLVTYG
jgi:hypothetical protein